MNEWMKVELWLWNLRCCVCSDPVWTNCGQQLVDSDGNFFRSFNKVFLYLFVYWFVDCQICEKNLLASKDYFCHSFNAKDEAIVKKLSHSHWK